MKALDFTRAQVRVLMRRESIAFVVGVGLLVVGGLLSAPALMFSGLVLLAISRRVLATIDRMHAIVFGLEVARDASDREESSVVVVRALGDAEPEADPKGTPLAVRALAAAAIVAVIAIFASFFHIGPSSAPAKQRWTFTDDSFDTGETWSIEHHSAATGGRALSKEASSPALLVALSAPARDVRAMTRCKAENGEGCGLAFRIADDRHYSVVRVTGENVQLARIEAGRETILSSKPLPPGGAEHWQELTLEARGDTVRVSVNGTRAIDHHDVRPTVAGGVGLWAPSRAWFDELAIEPLAPTPQSIEVLPFLRRPS